MDSQNIIHRDLKLENILLTSKDNNYKIKLADFGLSTTTDNINLFRHCGTPGYVAPEILMDKEYSTQVDMFSSGVILYSLYLPLFYQTHLTFKDLVVVSHIMAKGENKS